MNIMKNGELPYTFQPFKISRKRKEPERRKVRYKTFYSKVKKTGG